MYRLYDEENLKVRSVERKKIARRQRIPQSQARGPNQCWSADIVSDKLADGRSIRILTVIDQFTRECVWLEADRSMNGPKVVTAWRRAIDERGTAPDSITLDNGSEFAGRAMECWAIQTGVHCLHIGATVRWRPAEFSSMALCAGVPPGAERVTALADRSVTYVPGRSIDFSHTLSRDGVVSSGLIAGDGTGVVCS